MTGIILCMRPANERRRYIVTASLIGWALTQNGPSDGLVQETRNSIANALELHLSCTNSLICEVTSNFHGHLLYVEPLVPAQPKSWQLSHNPLCSKSILLVDSPQRRPSMVKRHCMVSKGLNLSNIHCLFFFKNMICQYTFVFFFRNI